MIKRLVTTRRRARYEAICAVETGFQCVIQALDSLISTLENLQTREDAQIICFKLKTSSCHFFYWEEILGQINLIQKKLQEPGVGLDLCNPHGCDRNFL